MNCTLKNKPRVYLDKKLVFSSPRLLQVTVTYSMLIKYDVLSQKKLSSKSEHKCMNANKIVFHI